MITTDTVSSNSRMNPSKLNVLNTPSVAKTTGVISGSGIAPALVSPIYCTPSLMAFTGTPCIAHKLPKMSNNILPALLSPYMVTLVNGMNSGMSSSSSSSYITPKST